MLDIMAHEAISSKPVRLSADSPRHCVYGYVKKYSRPRKLGCTCLVRVQPPVKLQFLPLYLFEELLSEARDHARADQLLSSVAKTACFIMH